MTVRAVPGPPRYVAACDACGWESAQLDSRSAATALYNAHVCGPVVTR